MKCLIFLRDWLYCFLWIFNDNNGDLLYCVVWYIYSGYLEIKFVV